MAKCTNDAAYSSRSSLSEVDGIEAECENFQMVGNSAQLCLSKAG